MLNFVVLLLAVKGDDWAYVLPPALIRFNAVPPSIFGIWISNNIKSNFWKLKKCLKNLFHIFYLRPRQLFMRLSNMQIKSSVLGMVICKQYSAAAKSGNLPCAHFLA